MMSQADAVFADVVHSSQRRPGDIMVMRLLVVGEPVSL